MGIDYRMVRVYLRTEVVTVCWGMPIERIEREYKNDHPLAKALRGVCGLMESTDAHRGSRYHITHEEFAAIEAACKEVRDVDMGP